MTPRVQRLIVGAAGTWLMASFLGVGCSKSGGGEGERGAVPPVVPATTTPVPSELPPPAPGSQPVSAPTPEASPAASSEVPRSAVAEGTRGPAFPPSVVDRIAETVEGAKYSATVAAPWGKVTVTGPSEGPGVVIARYWAAFSTASFDGVYAFAGGEMRERLGSYDSDAGRKDFTESIESRMTTNPVVAIQVDTAQDTGSERASGLVITKRADGTEEKREVYLMKVDGAWRIERVRQQR